MATWQPIETAPIWREVLLFYPEHGAGIRIGSRLMVEDPWRVGMDMNGVEPTHWSPLPEPPAGAAYWPPLPPPKFWNGRPTSPPAGDR